MSFGYRILGFGSGAGKNTYNVQYLVVAGGGGGGGANMGGSGAGAGGYRTVASKSFEVEPGTSYPITVGAGGAKGPVQRPYGDKGSSGSNSVFSTITSAGGGYGGGHYQTPGIQGGSGGSGGGGSYSTSGDGGLSLIHI